MLTLGLKGDFKNIIKALEKAEAVTLASFSFGSVSMNDLSGPDNLSFASEFTGLFLPSSNSGTISNVELDLVDLSDIDSFTIIEFGGFTVPFADVFTLGTSSFSYRESGWLPKVTTGEYTVTGSDGDDTLAPIGEFRFAGNDLVKAGAGNDQVSGGSGNDKLFGEDGNDTLTGDAGKDRLLGGKGSDHLVGGGGNDRLVGSKGVDTLIGGPGRDWLDGGKGKDVMTGSKGKDVFVFGSDIKTDTVTDFKIGVDRIDVRVATDFADLRITGKDDGALIKDGDHRMFLQGVDADDLGASDFLF